VIAASKLLIEELATTAYMASRQSAAWASIGDDVTSSDASDRTERETEKCRSVSGNTILWRKKQVRLYRDKKGITASDLARQLQKDPSVIRAIVREDHKKGFSPAIRKGLIEKLGISFDDWYAER
jgi:ribosome-binding protein aMBF1 (putative translation factor)